MVEAATTTETKPKLETLWQIGKADNKAKEFVRTGVWTKEFDYTVGQDSDPINSPSIPAVLTASETRKPARRASTDQLNIHFRLERNYSQGELILFYNRFGSEEDSLFLDGKLLTKVAGLGARKIQRSQIPLWAVNQGKHTLAITTASGNGRHAVDYLELKGIMPEETNQPQPETAQTTNSLAESEEDKVKKQATVFATGLEDYARWKTMFTERDTSGDPPFRRGRIWS